jgi:uncharacterized membrane protein
MFKKIKNIFRKDPQIIDINPEQQSLRKVLYWRAISTFLSMLIAFYYLGELYDTVEMTVIEVFVLTIIHYIFEELWDNSKQIE